MIKIKQLINKNKKLMPVNNKKTKTVRKNKNKMIISKNKQRKQIR